MFPPSFPARLLALSTVLFAAGVADAAAGSTDNRNAAGIDEIVVVAHKYKRPVRDVAAHVSVLTEAEIRDEHTIGLDTLFRYDPGIDANAAGSRFGSEGVTIRGIGGNRVEMLVDNVPVNEGFSIGSYSNATRDVLDAGLTQRVEVLRGPASALYGSNAIGGVMSVFTPDVFSLAGSNGFGADSLASWNSANSGLLATGVAAFAGRGAGILVGGSLANGNERDSSALDGQPDRVDVRNEALLVKAALDDASGRSWRIGWQRYTNSTESELVSMLGNGRLRSTTALAGDDRREFEFVVGELGFGDGGFVDEGVIRVYHSNAGTWQESMEERRLLPRPVVIHRSFAFQQETDGAELNVFRSFTSGRVTHDIGAGLEYRRTSTEESRDGLETGLIDGVATNMLLGETMPVHDFPHSRTEEWGAFVEDTLTINRFSITAALRADRHSLEPLNDPVFAEDNPAVEPVSVRDSEVTPKLGVVYRISNSSELYFQYAEGFRAPPFADANIGFDIPLFNYRAIPNPDLESERSQSYEAGWRLNGDWSSWQLSVFHTDYDDFIESRTRVGTDPASGRQIIQSVNIDAARISGIEGRFGLSLDGLIKGLDFDGALYAARGENRVTGEALNSVGPPEAVLGLDWKSEDSLTGLKLNATFVASWSDRDTSAGELFEPPGYGVLDLLITRELGRRVRLRAGVFNLADKTYWRWTHVGGLAPDDPVLPTLASPGRNYAFSIEAKWQ